MDASKEGRMNVWVDGSMDEGCVHTCACKYVYVYVWLVVFMYMYV